MTIREIRIFGDPVLKTASDLIRDFKAPAVQQLVQDLLDTVEPPGRAGVAAPQIGVNLRAFSYNVEGQVGCILNPKIVSVSGPVEEIEEGCLSVPGLWHRTPRHGYARVKGFDPNGNPVELAGEGLMAQMLQHECDHLDGLLYLDRLLPDSRKAAMRELRSTDWFMKGSL